MGSTWEDVTAGSQVQEALFDGGLFFFFFKYQFSL
jgi:hypothetical protein